MTRPAPAPARSGRPRWLVGIPLALVSLAVLAVLAEGATRLYYHVASRRFIHPYLGETYRPHHRVVERTPEGERHEYRLNNYGFRGQDVPDRKPEGARYVFTLGGSTTACADYPWGKTWPGVLQAHLRAALGADRIHVYNAGMGGATSYRSLLVLLNILTRLAPDLVVLYEGVNDMGTDRPGRAPYFADIGRGEELMQRRSYFLVELARRTRHPLVLRLAGVKGFLHEIARPAAGFEYHEKNYRDIAYLARGYRIRLVFMTQPVMPDSAATLGVNASTLRLGDELDVPVFDLAAAMPHRADFFQSDGVHYTAAGNRWIGEHLAAWIVAQRLLGS